MEAKPFDICERTFQFALKIIKNGKYMIEGQNEYVISKQLIRSGTAVGALVREAQNAESDKDFIHKMAIAQKECAETIYWIDILRASDYIEYENTAWLLDESKQLLKIIRTIILNKKRNMK